MPRLVGHIRLPSRADGEYDHADVHIQSGKIYIANTAEGSVEVVDGESMVYATTVGGCREASGVLCAQDEGTVFVAARGAGKILAIDVAHDKAIKEIPAGSTPNGLAWDSRRKHLLVADVKDNHTRLIDPASGTMLSSAVLKGRPRWCLYDKELNVFLVNVRDPAGVSIISPETMKEERFVRVSAAGPHGLGTVDGSGRVYVACDDRNMVVLDLNQEREVARITLSGPPDVVWMNLQKGRLYCATGEPGVIDVIDTSKLVHVGKIPTEEGAHTLTFDEKRQRLYSLLPKSNNVGVYSED